MINPRPLSHACRRMAAPVLLGWVVFSTLCLSHVLPRAHPAGLSFPALPVPRALLHADGDGNRIYDDLESRLAQADPALPVPVLVMFDAPLERVDLSTLRDPIGPIPVDRRFAPEAAIRTRLTPAQVRALATQPHVRLIEGDDDVRVARETAVPTFGVTKARNDYKLTGDDAVHDRDVGVEPFAGERAEDAARADHEVGGLLAPGNRKAPCQIDCGQKSLRRPARSRSSRNYAPPDDGTANRRRSVGRFPANG